MHQSSSSRPLKRMRSDAPLRPCFDQDELRRGTTTPDPIELDDDDLQTSIRVQDAASKRVKMSCSVDDTGSPIAPFRRSRFIEEPMKDASVTKPPTDYPASDAGTSTSAASASASGSAPSSGFSAAFRNALTPVWSGVSGVFGRRSTRDFSASTASTRTLSVQPSLLSRSTAGGRLSAYDATRTHSSHSNTSTAKDSGIYFMSGRESDKEHSRLSSLESPGISLRAVLNASPTMALEPTPRDPNNSVSPLKRLFNRASVSSLKKVRSHFALSGLRRATYADSGSESPEKIPAVPIIPEQFLKPDVLLQPQQSLKAQPSRADLKKRQKLAKKMSNLQVELEKCKQQYASTFGQADESEIDERFGKDNECVQTDNIRQDPASTSTKSARPLPPFPMSFQPASMRSTLDEPTEFAEDPSPSKKNGKLTALPQLPSSPAVSIEPAKTSRQVTNKAVPESNVPYRETPVRVEPLPSIEQKLSSTPEQIEAQASPLQTNHSLNHSLFKGPSFYPSDSAAYTDAITSTWEWHLEQNRRSLSTIMSSRAGSPDGQSQSHNMPLADLPVIEPGAPLTRAAKRSAAVNARRREATPSVYEDEPKQENRPITRSSNASSGNQNQLHSSDSNTANSSDVVDKFANVSDSIKISRIPRHSPRKQRSGEVDLSLPEINAIRSPPRRPGSAGGGSPKKRSEKDGVHKKRRAKKKSVGIERGEELGYYTEGGEWVWTEEAF